MLETNSDPGFCSCDGRLRLQCLSTSIANHFFRMKKRITAAATMSSRTTSGQNIPKITASTAAGIQPKANPKKPYVSVQNTHTPTNVAAAVIQVPTSYQSRIVCQPW